MSDREGCAREGHQLPDGWDACRCGERTRRPPYVLLYTERDRVQ